MFSSLPAEAKWTDYIPLAPGQQRHTYKISNITDYDLWHFCINRKDYVTQAWRVHDSVVCKAQGHSTVKAGFDLGFDVDYEQPFLLEDVCKWKHPRKGAFVGDGGYACYDTYRKF